MSHESTSRGFTLIELMIVVVVIAVLAVIAYPSYQTQIMKSRRARAQADMVGLAQIAERCHTVYNEYDNAACTQIAATPAAPFNRSPQEGSTVYYNITIASLADNTYTITATPAGGQASDACGTMTLAHTGAKTPTTNDC